MSDMGGGEGGGGGERTNEFEECRSIIELSMADGVGGGWMASIDGGVSDGVAARLSEEIGAGGGGSIDSSNVSECSSEWFEYNVEGVRSKFL